LPNKIAGIERTSKCSTYHQYNILRTHQTRQMDEITEYSTNLTQNTTNNSNGNKNNDDD